MSAADSLKETLEQHIESKALSLGQQALPGPVQVAIGYYLNGITLPLGDEGSLKVAGTSPNVTLDMKPVELEVKQPAEVDITITGSGATAGACIVAAFTKSGSDVSMDLTATMGDKLQWKVSDLWPTLLDHQPFNQLALAQGHLELTFDSGTKATDFTGKAALTFKGDELAAAVLRIVYDGSTSEPADQSKLGFLAGVVVTSWSPGSIWSPLRALSFDHSGLFFCSNDNAATEITKVLTPAEVPAVGTDFGFKAGTSFFTTLNLSTGSIKGLKDVFGDVTFSLFANMDLSDNLSMVAQLGVETPKGGAFKFDGLLLTWKNIGQAEETISAGTGGTLRITGQEQLTFELTGTIDTTGALSLRLDIENWVAPFGLSQVTVKDFGGMIEANEEGVTVALDAAFQFTTTGEHPEKFTFGVLGAVTDFEAPSGFAFELESDSPGQMLTLSEMFNGITTLEVPEDIKDVIDPILQIKKLDFSYAEVPDLVIDHKTLPLGLEFNGDIELLQVEEVKLNVKADEKKSTYSGKAEMVEAVTFGSVLTLQRDDTPQGQKQGPILQLSSTGDPYYLYVAAQVVFLDVLKASLQGQATKNGFKFVEKVTAGQKPAGTDSGAWAGEEIWITADAKKLYFGAGFSFDFGWQDVSLGPLEVWGLTIFPKIPLPNFEIGAGLSVVVDGEQASFSLSGDLKFEFLDAHWDPSFSVSVHLSEAPTSISHFAELIWDWVVDHLEDIFKSIWADIKKFGEWIKARWDDFKDEAEKVAHFLNKEFGKLAKEVAQFFKDVGYEAEQAIKALVAAGLAVEAEAKKIVDDIWGEIKKCAAKTATALM